MRITSAVFSLLVSLWVIPSSLSGVHLRKAAEHPAQTNTVFAKVKRDLLGKTDVPLRLPSFLPYADRGNPIYAIVQSVDRASYQIELAWTPDCLGGNNCHYGAVRGSAAPIVEGGGVRKPILLKGGIKAYFIDFTCGAHCDDAVIDWSESGYHYSVGMKAGKEATLLKIANSAIPDRDQQVR